MSWSGHLAEKNPYRHYYFASRASGDFALELEYRTFSTNIPVMVRNANYHTEHVFEVQQFQIFLRYLVRTGEKPQYVLQSALSEPGRRSYGAIIKQNRDPITDLLINPSCDLITTWPFLGLFRTAVAQLLAFCLSNHAGGIEDSDFVYLESRINSTKGQYFGGKTPEPLKMYNKKSATDLTGLRNLWSKIATTILVFDYLNERTVAQKYNHVSRRLRKMLVKVSNQAETDLSSASVGSVAQAWRTVAGTINTYGLVNAFDNWEDGFVDDRGKNAPGCNIRG